MFLYNKCFCEFVHFILQKEKERQEDGTSNMATINFFPKKNTGKMTKTRWTTVNNVFLSTSFSDDCIW